MSAYKTVLFDLDGTIVDSGEGIINSVRYALKKFGIDASHDDLAPFIGPPLNNSFEKYYGLTPKQAGWAVDYYREYYKPVGINQNYVYPQIPQLLEALSKDGFTLIVATSKPEIFAKQVLESHDLEKYFKCIAGAQMGEKGQSKDNIRIKKKDVIAYALETCGITDLSSLIMVGDRDQDVNGAKEIGIDCIGVLYGYGSFEELTKAGAKFTATTPMDVYEILK